MLNNCPHAEDAGVRASFNFQRLPSLLLLAPPSATRLPLGNGKHLIAYHYLIEIDHADEET
jgi:hypothetical protein